MSAADLSVPLHTALVASAPITALLPAYNGSFPVFTRRPAPEKAPYPMIVVSSDVTVNDDDGLFDYRTTQQRDVIAYGQNDVAAKYRVVEDLAYLVRDLFHRQRAALTVPGWHVVAITATGPRPAPTDDDKLVARVVSLTIQLAKPKL